MMNDHTAVLVNTHKNDDGLSYSWSDTKKKKIWCIILQL